jgi:hypothetical protein
VHAAGLHPFCMPIPSHARSTVRFIGIAIEGPRGSLVCKVELKVGTVFRRFDETLLDRDMLFHSYG